MNDKKPLIIATVLVFAVLLSIVGYAYYMVVSQNKSQQATNQTPPPPPIEAIQNMGVREEAFATSDRVLTEDIFKQEEKISLNELKKRLLTPTEKLSSDLIEANENIKKLNITIKEQQQQINDLKKQFDSLSKRVNKIAQAETLEKKMQADFVSKYDYIYKITSLNSTRKIAIIKDEKNQHYKLMVGDTIEGAKIVDINEAGIKTTRGTLR